MDNWLRFIWKCIAKVHVSPFIIKDPRTQPNFACSLLLPATAHAECCSLDIGWGTWWPSEGWKPVSALLRWRCLCNWGMASGQIPPASQGWANNEGRIFLFFYFFLVSSWAPVAYFSLEDRACMSYYADQSIPIKCGVSGNYPKSGPVGWYFLTFSAKVTSNSSPLSWSVDTASVITWGLVRNASSWAPPQTLWVRICILRRFSGDSDANSIWVTHVHIQVITMRSWECT